MSRTSPPRSLGHRCRDCGLTAAKWLGRCPECQAWGSLEEVGPAPLTAVGPKPATTPARPIADVDATGARARASGLAELDRVLGGGLVPGAVVLLAGEPGVGKSTLLLEVAAGLARTHGPVLYVSGEESAAQVRLRADRIGALDRALFLAAETDLGAVLGHVEAVRPALLVVDSVQTIASGAVDGAAGGVTQVREVAGSLIAASKSRDLTTILVGHVTKDGGIAGPRVLEHLVDVVLAFEGERHGRLRLLRASKNRFGPADEVGCFELREEGIAELPDPSGLFLSRRASTVAGTCVTVALEGKRPLVVEVQSLLADTELAGARSSVSGLDPRRLAMVLAVLSTHAPVSLARKEVFASTVGGVRLTEPAADLAIALAVASAERRRPLPADLAAVGEVGLAGDVRPVGGVARRLTEAARLGFRRAIIPRDPGPVPPDLIVIEVDDVAGALVALRDAGGRKRAGPGGQPCFAARSGRGGAHDVTE